MKITKSVWIYIFFNISPSIKVRPKVVTVLRYLVGYGFEEMRSRYRRNIYDLE